MFFFMESWRKYLEELGISETVRHLEALGRPSEWPLYVVDPAQKGACWLPDGKPWYKSPCPCYEGYYLLGGTGSVKCRAAEELLPGVVWYKTCSKDYARCPYYNEELIRRVRND